MLMQKIHDYDRDNGDKVLMEKRVKEMEDQMGAMTSEMQAMVSKAKQREAEIEEYQEKVELMESLEEKLRSSERENSEFKAAKLMSMFGGGGNAKSGAVIEALRIQLSEKTNDYLRIKEDNDRLREQKSVPVEFKASLDTSFNDEQIVEEHPKYKQLEQALKEKEVDFDKVAEQSVELESKLQRLMSDFSQFRVKAQQMLAQKEEEFDKIKGKNQIVKDDIDSPSKQKPITAVDQ